MLIHHHHDGDKEVHKLSLYCWCYNSMSKQIIYKAHRLINLNEYHVQMESSIMMNFIVLFHFTRDLYAIDVLVDKTCSAKDYHINKLHHLICML